MIIKVKKRKKIRQIIRKVLEKRKERRVDYKVRDGNIKERKQNEPKARNTK
jgi:hypothetical protein